MTRPDECDNGATVMHGQPSLQAARSTAAPAPCCNGPTATPDSGLHGPWGRLRPTPSFVDRQHRRGASRVHVPSLGRGASSPARPSVGGVAARRAAGKIAIYGLFPTIRRRCPQVESELRRLAQLAVKASVIRSSWVAAEAVDLDISDASPARRHRHSTEFCRARSRNAAVQGVRGGQHRFSTFVPLASAVYFRRRRPMRHRACRCAQIFDLAHARPARQSSGDGVHDDDRNP